MRKIIKLILLILIGLLFAMHTGCSGGTYSAVDGDDAEAVAKMLDETPRALGEFDEDGHTLLHKAALQGSVKVIGLLVERGADVNERSRDGNAVTPLHLAAHKGHLEAVKLLINSNADVNLTASSDFFRWDTLSFAIEGNNKEMVEFLLANGASAAVTGTVQVNPLLFAAHSGNVEIAEILIANGANVSTPSKFKKVQLLRGMVAKILVPKVGRIKYVEDIKTPLDIAETKQFTRMAKLLKNNGATR